MTVKRFEDLDIWKEARDLSKQIFEITSVSPFENDFRFRDQIRAASGSVMDNIAEGFHRGGNKEFYQFLSIARGSLGEVRSQIYRALDYNYIEKEKQESLVEFTDILSRKISKLMQHISNSDLKGLKYL